MVKILILGGSGLVGRALINELNEGHDVYGTFASSVITSLPGDKQFQLEVQEIGKLVEIVSLIQPDIVISCLRGEFDHQLKFHKRIAEVLRNTKSRLYFFSTTNVFDGDFSKSHVETDPPIAESDYGKFKIECEKMLKDILADRAIILRIPAIWGKNSRRWNLIQESIKNNKSIDVYSNLICNNLLDVDLARQLRFIIENNLKGIFHMGSADTMSQSQFFEQILSKLGDNLDLLQYSLFEDNSQTYYFMLNTNRNDLPESLKSTNKDIISYLLG
ncbi:sugar nucleotide-binding protein [Bacillus sp. OK048]|uniref:sugar nucleotide-binding protein n=1 Tax=Bacillus sp. OK048 TaxID=1882761 RepID=UPI0008860A54|nr:sugar nucleotide-binding protein [Bacillus sp. OK048]SDN72590.1 dTDP-4-dehydrorhamnose reductase [Bacillus sp. OK048]